MTVPTNHRNSLHLINWVCDAHGLTPADVRFEASAVSFKLGKFNCWANDDGLTVGGKGLIYGTLTKALVGLCYSVRC